MSTNFRPLMTAADLRIFLRPLNGQVVSHETFGSETFAYVSFNSQEERRSAERSLIRKGFRIDESYWPESAVTEIRVRKCRKNCDCFERPAMGV